MYRLISFFVIFSFVAVMIHLHNESAHQNVVGESNHHSELEVNIPHHSISPTIKGEVSQDLSGSWFLKIYPQNFTFTPEKAGSEEIIFNEGHAHLYINDKKINRLYAEYYHIGELPKGKNKIKVTLNANNHGVYKYQGKEIAFIEEITVP